jgi:sodium-dependent dicarboxylate transporter 2/3/5
MTEPVSPGEARFDLVRRRAGLLLGPAAFALLWLGGPQGLSLPAKRLSAVVAWALVWWITEAVPIPVTAVLAPALAVLVGVGEAGELFAPFADPIVFLFLGSFVLAEGISDSGLDRRIAYAVLSRPAVGSSTVRIFRAVVGLVAGLSMWLSNTAAAAIGYPVALSLLRTLSASQPEAGPDLRRTRYGVGLLLGLAYAASIGGIGTPVGTPPNLIAVGQLAQLAGVRVAFFQWMMVALPVMGVLLAILAGYLLRALPPEVREIPGAAEIVRRGRAALGPISRRERNVLAAFALTASLWVLPGLVAAAAGPEAPLARMLARHVPEGVAAVLGAGPCGSTGGPSCCSAAACPWAVR